MGPTTNHRLGDDSPPGTQNSGSEGITEQAREEAGQLKETSADAARQVTGTVKDKASDVTTDVREQTQRLAGQTRDQLAQQAGQQKEKAAQGLRSMGDELRGMAEHGQSGWGAQLARQGADFTEQAADFLQKHEPADLLDEVRGFARRRPGTFLLVAATAGVVAGRLSRALAAGTPSDSSNGRSTAGQPAADDYMVPAPPVAPTPPTPIPTATPVPTPVAPDPDPGAPVTPTFGPGTER